MRRISSAILEAWCALPGALHMLSQPCVSVLPPTLGRYAVVRRGVCELQRHQRGPGARLPEVGHGCTNPRCLWKLMVRVGCADTPGRFEFHCNVQDHYKAGMKGVLEVQPKVGVLSQGQLPIWRRRRALT